jgi:hypothetical protein
MKFSVRQMLASAGGAVLAAVIASLFGVKGTIIGVAIGSLAATFGTAMVSQSIERGHAAVKQVVVKVPERANLLRRLGGTAASGQTQTAEPGADAHDVTEPVTTAPVAGDATTQMAVPSDDTSVMEIPQSDTERVITAPAASDATIQMAVPSDDTGVMAIHQHDDADVTRQLPVSGGEPDTAEMPIPVPPARSIPWRTIIGTAVIVFILSLVLVTGIELIAGHPLSDLFGNNKNNDPSIVHIFTPGPATTTTTSSTTTTSTSTTTTSSTSTTTTTTPGATTTSTTPGQSTTTTSSGLFGTTTTTSATTVPPGG